MAAQPGFRRGAGINVPRDAHAGGPPSIVFDVCDHDGLPTHQITVASEDDYAILVVPADRTRCADSSMLHIDVKIPKAHVVVAAGND